MSLHPSPPQLELSPSPPTPLLPLSCLSYPFSLPSCSKGHLTLRRPRQRPPDLRHQRPPLKLHLVDPGRLHLHRNHAQHQPERPRPQEPARRK